jgi:tetratricopeptide (TPR) repeat protein
MELLALQIIQTLVPPPKRTQPRRSKKAAPQEPSLREIRELFDRGLAHHTAGQLDDAMALYRQLLALVPWHADARNNLGAALLAKGRIPEAIQQYEVVLGLHPRHFNAMGNLAAALAAQGRLDEAVARYQSAIAIDPAQAGAHYNLAGVLTALGRTGEAARSYRMALALKSEYAEAHNNLANLLATEGDHESAATHYRRALEINPRHAAAHNNLGSIARDLGRFDEAVAHFDRAIAIQPKLAEAHYHRAEIRTFRRGDADLTELEALAERADWRPRQAPFVHFALAKALEDVGDYERSFEHMRRGNDLKRSQTRYDEAAAMRQILRVAETFDRDLLERLRGEGDPSEAPIFVVGMPRSGSSLIEQILASHPRIHGAGEREDLERVAGAGFPEDVRALGGDDLRRMGAAYLNRLVMPGGALRIVDKLPHNFLRIGLIRLILPNARIIHTMRDPMDTCLSCYSKLFAAGQHFSYDLAELGRYYQAYAALMDHWRVALPAGPMLDVAYEDVVDDIEGQARRLIEFCGLEWDDRCLSFHTNKRVVKTASSVQVRKPLFRSSVQRWRRFEAGLEPLRAALGEIRHAVAA